MEEAAELADYLPLCFRPPKEREYIERLQIAEGRTAINNNA
jgi:hypothetical protein